MPKHLVHIHSVQTADGQPKLPEPSILNYGEIAINYATDHETISFKNQNDEIATFKTHKLYTQLLGDKQDKTDDSLTTQNKTIVGALNELKTDLDDSVEPYVVNLTNLLSANDSESISAAIGGIENLNSTISRNQVIFGVLATGTVAVGIRVFGNQTTLNYFVDSVLGLTINEITITNTDNTLSKKVETHAVLTENMVINSLTSDETTLPLSAAQGKALDSKISSIDVSADISNAINALDSSGQTASTGEVISSVSQENGVISVAKKTLSADDIPTLPQSKITDLETTLAGKQDAGDYATNSALTEGLAGKQDTISFNTAYNASTNKAATMQDVTSAVSDKVEQSDITSAIQSLDSTGQTCSTGEVISSVSQEDGIVSVQKKTLTIDDLPVEDINNKLFGLYPYRSSSDTALGLSKNSNGNLIITFEEGHQEELSLGATSGLQLIAPEVFGSDELQYAFQTGDMANWSDPITLQNKLTAGTGIKITKGNVINVTLDTTVFFVAEIAPASPSEDQKKKICLVPADTTEEGNFYTEYVWVVDDTHPDGYWEEFGTYKSEVDLADYLKTSDAESTYLKITDAESEYATKTELAGKQNSTDDTLKTTSKNIVGAINEILPKATGVGKIDPNSDGNGEIFNVYKGGNANKALGMYSHAEGYTTVASGAFAHAEGTYNFNDSSAIHMVGIGNSGLMRQNAHVIKHNGDHFIIGIGGYEGQATDSAQSLQEVINSMQPTVIDVSTLFADSATITSGLSSQIAAYGESTATDFPLMYAGASIGNIKPTWIRTSAGITNFMCIADNKIWYFEIKGTTVQRASLAIS